MARTALTGTVRADKYCESFESEKFRVDKMGRSIHFFQRLFFFSLFESGANLQPRLACSVGLGPRKSLCALRETWPTDTPRALCIWSDDFPKDEFSLSFLPRRMKSEKRKKNSRAFSFVKLDSSFLHIFSLFFFWNERISLTFFFSPPRLRCLFSFDTIRWL